MNRPFEALLRGHADLDELIVYDRAGLASTGELFLKLIQGRFDLAIDLQGLLRSALMTAATRAKVRVGVADAREGARWFYTDLVDAPRLGLHAVERVQRVARALDARMPRDHDSTCLSGNPIGEWARQALAGLPSPWNRAQSGSRAGIGRWHLRAFLPSAAARPRSWAQA